METMARKTVAVMVVVALLVGSAAALCGMDDEGLAACKPWVTKPPPTAKPTATCCGSLSKADFSCLCSYKNSMLLPSFGIDPELALALPAKCELPITPPADCQ